MVNLGEQGVGLKGAEIYLDHDSIRKAGGYVYMWGLINYLDPDEWGDLSAKRYKKIDCDSSRVQQLEIEVFDSHFAKGKLVSLGKATTEWHYIRPDSAGGIVIGKACKLAK